jgi:K+-sensing histidine kinase KdpD
MIAGNAESLRRNDTAVAAEDRITALTDIEQSAYRLANIVENMLLLARVEAASGAIPEPVLLHRLVPTVVESHRERHRGREIVVEAVAALPAVLAVPSYVEQIVENFLSNADKYSPAGIPVHVKLDASAGEVRLRVIDSGAGMSTEERERAFQPFFRSERWAPLVSGVGLGLAVCKRLAEVQGGRVWCVGRDQGGTEFGFALPVMPGD